MLIIPPERKSNSSEEYVKDLLKDIKWNDAPQARAYWSLLVPEHPTKPWTECDFLIAWDHALICLEVKGGHSISCSESGVWSYAKADGTAFTKSESPMDQIISGSMSIKRRLEKELGKEITNKFTLGWGVVFPYHDFNQIPGFEFDRSNTIDRSGIKEIGLGQFIRSLETHWRAKQNRNPRLLGADPDDSAKMFKYLRGQFHLVRPISSYIEEYEKKTYQATEEQLSFIESIRRNDRCLCEGGAGTGKTLMAFEVAKIKKAETLRVGFVCRNKQFSIYARQVLSQYDVTVICTEEIDLNNLPTIFDCLVVDEGQDCMTVGQIELIDALLKEGIEGGSCYWFMDKNNQSHFYDDFDPDCINFLDNYSKFFLSYNCRNTLPMINLIKDLTGGDCGKPKVDSPGLKPVIRIGFDDKEAQASELTSIIIDLIDEGVEQCDITVLTTGEVEDSCVNRLTNNLQLGRPNKPDRNLNKIEFYDVVSFKGQENKIVIVVDLYDIHGDALSLSRLYTATSRPNQHLIIVLSQEAGNTFQNLVASK